MRHVWNLRAGAERERGIERERRGSDAVSARADGRVGAVQKGLKQLRGRPHVQTRRARARARGDALLAVERAAAIRVRGAEHLAERGLELRAREAVEQEVLRGVGGAALALGLLLRVPHLRVHGLQQLDGDGHELVVLDEAVVVLVRQHHDLPQVRHLQLELRGEELHDALELLAVQEQYLQHQFLH